jgi:hypothetical protein
MSDYGVLLKRVEGLELEIEKLNTIMRLWIVAEQEAAFHRRERLTNVSNIVHEEGGSPDGGIPPGSIKGPSWVNLMTYRKAGWEAEPSRKRPVSAIYEDLAAELIGHK